MNFVFLIPLLSGFLSCAPLKTNIDANNFSPIKYGENNEFSNPSLYVKVPLVKKNI